MKAPSPLIIVGLAAVVLPLSTQAADVTWGTATNITAATDIQSAGITNLAGANFGNPAQGSTTPASIDVDNGAVLVTFTRVGANTSSALANGITVATSSEWGNWGYNNGNSSMAGNYGVVLDTNIGREETTPLSATITLSGLTENTQYQIQFWASATGVAPNQTISGSPVLNTDTGSNGQFVVGTFTADPGGVQVLTVNGADNQFIVANALAIGTVSGGGPDTTPPEWTATWPQVAPLSSSSLNVRAKTNEAGTAYYVVLPDGADAPSAAQVKAGTDSNDTPVSASGSLALTANTEATAPVGSLSPSTAYDVYFVAEDAVPNLQASPTMVDATTLAPDTTAPDWIATWPQAGQLSPTSITVRARTNENGTAYYVVLADGATPAPSAAQVKALTDGNGVPVSASGSLALTANTEATGPVTGLTADTSYDVYFVAEDAVPNLQAAPLLVNVSLVSPAVVTWGSWTAVSDETAIQTPGGYTYGGVNFNGSDTTIGSVAFTSIAQNASGTANDITVSSTGFAFQSTGSGNSNVVSTEGSPQTWATVLDRVIGDDNNSAAIDLTGLTPGTDYTLQFFSSTPDGGINATTMISSGGVDSPQFGSHTGGETRYIIASFTANSSSQSFTITGAEPTFGALVIGVESAGGNSFADWIGTFTGLNGLTAFADDADFDGLDNGVENFLGTPPNAGNAGLTAGTLSGNTFTFTHPQNATPASDVSAPVYTWSTDLVTWNADEASFGGVTVDLAPDTDNPVAGTTTVSATVTVGTVPAKLFVRLGVSQE
jgi:hypothetical protein